METTSETTAMQNSEVTNNEEDLKERRKMQNRVAQRRYSKLISPYHVVEFLETSRSSITVIIS